MMSKHTDDEYADAILADANREPPKSFFRALSSMTTSINRGARNFMLATTDGYYTDTQYAERTIAELKERNKKPNGLEGIL